MFCENIKMSRHLKKAGSLLNIICRSSYSDCVNFFENLDYKGIELICKLIYYITSGEITFDPTSHKRLRKKIRKHIRNIKRLFLIPQNQRDINKKKKILQQRGIVSILTAVAHKAIPHINELISKQV